MVTKLNVKPIDFKLGEYFSKGIEELKKDFGSYLVATLFIFIMSIIPFCGLLAMGNFYKFCKKKINGQSANPSEIFNFDDFMPYFKLYLILLAIILIFEIPLLFLMFAFSENANAGSSPPFFMFPLIFAFVAFIFWLTAKAFYMPALISLSGIKDYKKAWSVSKEMTKGNILTIILFSIALSFLSQIGVILCVVGIFLTMPLQHLGTFFAYDDAIKQISTADYQPIENNSF